MTHLAHCGSLKLTTVCQEWGKRGWGIGQEGYLTGQMGYQIISVGAIRQLRHFMCACALLHPGHKRISGPWPIPTGGDPEWAVMLIWPHPWTFNPADLSLTSSFWLKKDRRVYQDTKNQKLVNAKQTGRDNNVIQIDGQSKDVTQTWGERLTFLTTRCNNV